MRYCFFCDALIWKRSSKYIEEEKIKRSEEIRDKNRTEESHSRCSLGPIIKSEITPISFLL